MKLLKAAIDFIETVQTIDTKTMADAYREYRKLLLKEPDLLNPTHLSDAGFYFSGTEDGKLTWSKARGDSTSLIVLKVVDAGFEVRYHHIGPLGGPNQTNVLQTINTVGEFNRLLAFFWPELA